jgi:L-alanine-DL-glutamate epimerase-like enolase superfamily enzyme
MDIAAGEYGFEVDYFERMIDAGSVDVLQADVTRCGGITGFLLVGSVCAGRHMPLSTHCAPSAHLHAACCIQNLVHMEYFHDHVRIERMLFDGATIPENGALRPDRNRPGMGLEFKESDARRFAL